MIEANPLVEETRNQVAVKRGPVVYCLESTNLNKNNSVFELGISSSAKFKTTRTKIGNSSVIGIETTAKKIGDNNWSDQLYKEVSKQPASTVNIKLIPYYTWGNRGHAEMSVWLPVSR